MNLEIAENGYEFSENQKNLWQIGSEQMNSLHHQIAIHFENGVTLEAVQKAVNTLTSTHEVCTFLAVQNENYQYPLQTVASGATDISATEETFHRNYAPGTDLPIRFLAVANNGKVSTLQLKIYALWADSYTAVRLASELSQIIQQEGATVTTEAEEKIGYLQFCAWQNELIGAPEQDAIDYWKANTLTLRQPLFPRAGEASEAFSPNKTMLMSLSGDAYTQLKDKASRLDATVEELLFHSWAAYLCTYFDQEITLGYLPFKRAYDELQDTMGLVNKTLPINASATLFSEATDASLTALKNQITEKKEWADYFSLERENHFPANDRFFEYCFEYLTLEGNTAIQDIHTVHDVFGLKLTAVDFGDRLVLELYADEAKIKQEELAVIKAQLVARIEDATATTLTKEELDIIELSNDTEMVFEEGSVISLFEKQVVENPDAFAIIHGEETLTYATLNDKVNALANALLSSGQLEGNAPVGILASHSEWAIISMLAVQKAGGYYIPIDEKYPKERIEFIIQDSGCKLLLQHGGVDYGFEGLTVIDPTGSSIYAQELATVSTEIVADTIAYCIYTSGSTGQPKGCLVTHGNLYNYVSWANDYYFGGTDSGNFGFITSISFDLTVTSIFTTLTRGKKISIHTQEHISELLRATFEDNNVDTLKLTPAHLILAKELNIQNTSVRTLICGGEQLTQHHIDCVRAIHPEIQVFNEYGPTEATVGCVVAKIDTEDTAPITIGKPIANTKITILDASGNLAPIGVMGELMISGSGVAKGYVNREALTAERFVTIAATRSYKTGDLGRWLPDGTIEYYKRADDQVKVKGYRIELKEIEAVLRENETIQEAVVLIDGDVDKEIIAFVQATHEQNEMELIALLSEKLPEYMIPTAFVQIATVPLTPNGKIDKKYLLELKNDQMISDVEYVAPETETQKQLVEIWQGILRREKIGIDDDFFNIGGDSIRAVKIVSELQRIFNVNIDIVTLFQEPNIRGLSEQIDNQLWQDATLKEEDVIDKTVI